MHFDILLISSSHVDDYLELGIIPRTGIEDRKPDSFHLLYLVVEKFVSILILIATTIHQDHFQLPQETNFNI